MNSWPPIAELAEKIRGQKMKAATTVEQALKAIEEHHDYQAIISTTAQRARRQAKEIDEKIARGEDAGRLAGVPFIAKDNLLTFGGETTAASNILKGFRAPYQATVIDKLEAEGAICVAKANMDAFGHGTSTENSDYFVTKNPHDPKRVPGGSSGGPAVSVVLGMVPFALGTDTGGSNRHPASLSGCVGYKPTYGLVSRSGVVAMASSTDTVGPLANRVEDAAAVLEVIAGPDRLDSTSISRDEESYSTAAVKLSDQKIGLIKEYMGEGLSEGVRRSILMAVRKLKDAGACVEEVNLPSLSLALASYYIVVPAEISSNLSRYDGQHYGFSAPKAVTLHDSYSQSRSKGFGNEAKRRVMIGTYVLSSGYYDAYYRKAQQVRTKLIEEFTTVFQKVDFLIGPVAPHSAFKVGENTQDPLQMYLEDIMTVSASLVGIPAISIPAPPDGNLPVGLQIMAPQRHDRQLLGLARAAEAVL